MKFILIAFISLAVALSICGQGLQQTSKEDSVRVKKMQVHDAQLFLFAPLPLLQFELNTVQEYYPESLHLKFGSSSNSLESIIEQNLDVSEIWKIGKLKEDELKTLRSILGSVQFGGVAYLAYKHIKKYGLK